MKYNFAEVKLLDIEGKEFVEQERLYQLLARWIFRSAYNNLELTEAARIIFKGEPVELDKAEALAIKTLITKPPIGQNGQRSYDLTAFAVKAVSDYIDSVLESKG